MPNLTFLLLISLWGIQSGVSPSPQYIDQNSIHCSQQTKQKDIANNNSLSLVHLGLNMNLRFQLLWLQANFPSSNLQFIPTANINDSPTGQDHCNAISSLRSPFFSLAVTLHCLCVLSVQYTDTHCTCNVTLRRVRITVVAAGKEVTEQKYVFCISLQFCLKYFLLHQEFSAIPQMHTGLHVKWPSFVSDFSGTLITQTDFLDRLKYKI